MAPRRSALLALKVPEVQHVLRKKRAPWRIPRLLYNIKNRLKMQRLAVFDLVLILQFSTAYLGSLSTLVSRDFSSCGTIDPWRRAYVLSKDALGRKYLATYPAEKDHVLAQLTA